MAVPSLQAQSSAGQSDDLSHEAPDALPCEPSPDDGELPSEEPPVKAPVGDGLLLPLQAASAKDPRRHKEIERKRMLIVLTQAKAPAAKTAAGAPVPLSMETTSRLYEFYFAVYVQAREVASSKIVSDVGVAVYAGVSRLMLGQVLTTSSPMTTGSTVNELDSPCAA